MKKLLAFVLFALTFSGVSFAAGRVRYIKPPCDAACVAAANAKYLVDLAAWQVTHPVAPAAPAPAPLPAPEACLLQIIGNGCY